MPITPYFPPDRRDILAAGAALALPGAGWAAARAAVPLGPARPFSFDLLKQQARAMAARPYAAPPQPSANDPLKAMSFDTYAQARYRPDRELWKGVPGAQRARLFPQGRYYAQPVAIHIVEDGKAREAIYSPDLFDMPANHPLRRLTSAGFAGFRLMSPSRAGESDWLAYLGASYFRASDPFDQYGASARGLAINAGGREEFPRFSAFWLEQNGGQGMTVYALLESRSVTGAYRMDSRRIDGGAGGAVQEVACALNVRSPIDLLGLAPLTGMFWYGENSGTFRGDWRPEVHDCDGLALWTGAGERLWRPLANPPRVVTNSYVDQGPKGFGLIQRDRNFENYQDDNLLYDRRPSIWVEPLDDWGRGAVNLVQLPTASEQEDNVVAFWTPAAPVAVGQTLEARYRLHWGLDAPADGDQARVVATRVGLGGMGGRDLDRSHVLPGGRKFMIDVEGKALDSLAQGGGVQAEVSASRGKLSGVTAFPVIGTRRWRMAFDLSDLDNQPADLRAYLKRGGRALSETWIYEAFP